MILQEWYRCHLHPLLPVHLGSGCVRHYDCRNNCQFNHCGCVQGVFGTMIVGTIVSLITGGYMVMIVSRRVRHYDYRNNRQFNHWWVYDYDCQ